MPSTQEYAGVSRSADTESKPSKSKPSVAVLNFWLDAGLFVSLVFVMWVSAILQMIFPAPTAAAGWQLWGLTYDQWRNMQFAGLCVFALLTVEHLVLHWNWICTMLTTRILRLKNRPDEGVQAVYGIGTFIMLLVLTMGSILIAMFAVQSPLGQ